jgi:hypothetical protein
MFTVLITEDYCLRYGLITLCILFITLLHMHCVLLQLCIQFTSTVSPFGIILTISTGEKGTEGGQEEAET